MECVKIFDDKFHQIAHTNPRILGYFGASAIGALSIDETLHVATKEENIGQPSMSCSTCQVTFETVTDQRDHCKLDWHRCNIKRILHGQSAITETDFASTDGKYPVVRIKVLPHIPTFAAVDVSSISGTDSDSSESSESSAAILRSQVQGRLYVETGPGSVFLLYRCLLAEKKQEIIDLSQSLAQLKNPKWAIIMLGGGHFAGGIFNGVEQVIHKTLHSYTVRAGQGGSQSGRDNKSGTSAPRSAGASLRRYNEQTFAKHVADILKSWKEELACCNFIAFRAPGPHNKSILFDSRVGVLSKTDPRLRSIPFPTKRATFKEVCRVHDMLSDVIIYHSREHIPKEIRECRDREPHRRSKVRNASLNRAKSRETVQRPLPYSDGADDIPIEGDSLTTADEDSSEYELSQQMSELSFEEKLEEFGDSLTPAQRRNESKSRPRNKRKSQGTSGRAECIEAKKRAKGVAHFEHNVHQSILTGDLARFRGLLKQSPELINCSIDPDDNTALHVCAELKKPDYIQLLLEAGADLCVKNIKQQTPYTITLDKSIRDMLKLFAQENPDKFNYNKAQIPITEKLTSEEIEERKQKQQQQRKAKREREKEKRRQKLAEKLEEDERVRFANLSDREKRALAAERRILGANGAVISRCYQCGTDMSGKVPFEYNTYRFCNMACLKAHRLIHPVVLS